MVLEPMPRPSPDSQDSFNTAAVKYAAVLAIASYPRVPGNLITILKEVYPKTTRTVLQNPALAEAGSKSPSETRGARTSHSPFTQYGL